MPRSEKPAVFPVHVLPEKAFIASDRSAAFGEHAPSHRIDFYAIVWFRETKGVHLIDFESFPVKKDTVFCIGLGQIHAIPAARLPKARTIVFSKAFFEGIGSAPLRNLFLPFQNEAIRIPPAMVEPLTALFDLILLEYGGIADEELLLRYLSAFLTHLHRFGQLGAAAGGAVDSRILHLLQLLQENYKDEKSARFYARQVGLSPKRINELLRGQVGSTISQLIYQLLIIEAKRELFHQELSIKEIAYDLGFSEQSYFARFFRKHTGQRPEAFRKAALRAAGLPVLMFR